MQTGVRLELVKDGAVAEIFEPDGVMVSLGRELTNAVSIDSIGVSRQHGAILAAGNQWVYRDLGSTNGSSINGQVLKPHQLYLLREGAALRLGDTQLKFSITGEGELNSEQASLLVFFNDRFEGERFFLPESDNTISIGGPGCDLVVEEQPIGDEPLASVSSRDRFIIRVSETARLPTLLNGHMFHGSDELVDGDLLKIDAWEIVVNAPGSQQRSSIYATDQMEQAGRVPSEEAPYVTGAPPQQVQNLDSWESEASKRRRESGQRFVFGAEGDEEDALPGASFGGGAGDPMLRSSPGFEIGPSQRFSGIMSSEEDDNKELSAQKFLVTLAICVIIAVALVLGLLIFKLAT